MRKTVLYAIAGPFALGTLLLAIRLFHLGPFGIRPGDDILLARLSSINGPSFFVIGHRTKFATEPYEVTLYKIGPSNRVSSYYLAFEDSYWWGCSIKSNRKSGEIEIRADGAVSARYVPVKDVVVSDAYRIPISARAADYAQVQKLISASKR